MLIDHISEGSDAFGIMRRYVLAILAAIAALLLRGLLSPFLQQHNPYHTIWAAVAFSAWYCGLGPSIATTLVGAAGVWYWFLPPVHSFRLQDPKTEVAGVLGFLVFSSVIIALGEENRRSLIRSKWAEEQLRKAHDELERKVQVRTADLNLANESLRELSGRLLRLQDEERRKIARELHDSVGQLLAALSINLGSVQHQSDKLDAAGARAISENVAMVDQISREIRTISHLLHPPLLDAVRGWVFRAQQDQG
jgi:signal transduction histidine kinase